MPWRIFFSSLIFGVCFMAKILNINFLKSARCNSFQILYSNITFYAQKISEEFPSARCCQICRRQPPVWKVPRVPGRRRPLPAAPVRVKLTTAEFKDHKRGRKKNPAQKKLKPCVAIICFCRKTTREKNVKTFYWLVVKLNSLSWISLW